ncbi:MAG TPA: preprotein translocase subunit SecG [Candidatus Paceibacterota bacterium]|nr:preprotein translocase subunit SecG [Candidatus Paceibacterota bacterium]
MDIITILTYIQLASAVLLIITILMQQRGQGLGSAFGGSSMEYSTKRGVERIVFVTSIVVAAVFVGASVARLVLAS